MSVATDDPLAPPAATVERWAWDYIRSTDAAYKLQPPPIPATWEDGAPARCLTSPGRSLGWRVVDKAPRRVKRGSLAHHRRRCQLFHTFLHHELQAAELMGWAILAFPAAPRAFRRGLVSICVDELRHLQMYRGYLERQGARFGDFPLRDWFWTRVPLSTQPAQFVAVMGIGFEGGNLDHAERFATWFRDAGDVDAVAILDVVRSEEVRHVRFAAHWFGEFTGGVEFDAWRAHLPPPLTPTVMRGRELNRHDRARSGLSDTFLDRLAEWSCASPGC